VDKVPGLDGLGTHLGGAVGVVTNTVATLERINDPDFQNEPFVQQAGCAVFGTTVEVVGTLFTVPLALVSGPLAVGATAYLSPHASNAGDDAQQNCHDVINMFK